MTQVEQHRDGTQRPEYAARPKGVAHTLLDPITLRDFEIQSIGIQAALLKGCYHIVRAFDGSTTVSGGLDAGG